MASNSGYDGATTPTVGHFDKEQRARLEALTFSRALLKGGTIGRSPTLDELLTAAVYIHKGETP